MFKIFRSFAFSTLLFAAMTHAKIGGARTLQFGGGGPPGQGGGFPPGQGGGGFPRGQGGDFPRGPGEGFPPNGFNNSMGPPGGDDDIEGHGGGPEGALPEFLMQLGFPDVLEDALVNVTCTIPTETDSLPPACAFSPRSENGTWACRTLYNPITGVAKTMNTCVNPEGKGLDTDTCGCCDDICPVPCGCTCDFESPEGEILEGVLLNFTRPVHMLSNATFADMGNSMSGSASNATSVEIEESVERCIPVAWANTLLALTNQRGNPTCVTACEA